MDKFVLENTNDYIGTKLNNCNSPISKFSLIPSSNLCLMSNLKYT